VESHANSVDTLGHVLPYIYMHIYIHIFTYVLINMYKLQLWNRTLVVLTPLGACFLISICIFIYIYSYMYE